MRLPTSDEWSQGSHWDYESGSSNEYNFNIFFFFYPVHDFFVLNLLVINELEPTFSSTYIWDSNILITDELSFFCYDFNWRVQNNICIYIYLRLERNDNQCCGSGSAWIRNFCLDRELKFRIRQKVKEHINKTVSSGLFVLLDRSIE